MTRTLGRLIDTITSSLQTTFGSETPEQRAQREEVGLQQTVATLLFETARADHDIKVEDLHMVEASLCEFFELSTAQVKPLLDYASEPRHRPTSYHPLVRIINDKLGTEEKNRLIEFMWRVAHADDHIDTYEDHLVRKISELLYVPHREFIAAKHRARASNTGRKGAARK